MHMGIRFEINLLSGGRRRSRSSLGHTGDAGYCRLIRLGKCLGRMIGRTGSNTFEGVEGGEVILVIMLLKGQRSRSSLSKNWDKEDRK